MDNEHSKFYIYLAFALFCFVGLLSSIMFMKETSGNKIEFNIELYGIKINKYVKLDKDKD